MIMVIQGTKVCKFEFPAKAIFALISKTNYWYVGNLDCHDQLPSLSAINDIQITCLESMFYLKGFSNWILITISMDLFD